MGTMRNEIITLSMQTIDGSWIMAKGENPVLSTLLDINAVSLERTELDPQTLILIRLAALITVDAPVSSYLLHLGAGGVAYRVDPGAQTAGCGHGDQGQDRGEHRHQRRVRLQPGR